MSTFTLGAKQVYTRTLQALGAAGVSSPKQTAVEQAVQSALSYIWTYQPWTWRRKRMDVQFTVSTPYYALPADFESLGISQLEREDSSDAEYRFIRAANDLAFWNEYACASSNEPRVFRVVYREVGSTYVPVMEPAPPPDDTYNYPDADYYCACPEVTFSDSTGTVPNMPAEFFDVWSLAAEWRGAKALGRHKLASLIRSDLDDMLASAAKRFDVTYPDGPPMGLDDPYGDLQRLR